MTKSILETRSNVIEYSEGQIEALNKVSAFLNSSDTFFLLAGFSGTGKTTIAENIATFAKADLLAPTNAAVNRLREKINTKSANTEFSTIHKILFTPTQAKAKFIANGGFKLKKTYIIDECSMIDKYILGVIIQKATEQRCKVIFMGDSHQLPPVAEDPHIFAWEKSYPDSFKPENKYELTQVRRYDGNLLKIATEMRTTKTTSFTKIDNDDLVITDKFSKQLIKDIKSAASYIVITSTNAKRVKYNEKIRSVRYGLTGTQLNYALEGDKLVSVNNNSFYSNGEIYFINGEIFVTEFNLQIESSSEDSGYKTYRVLLYDNKQEKKRTLLLPDLIEPSMQGPTLIKGIENNRDEISDSLYHSLLNIWTDKKGIERKALNKDLVIATYGYAISCHKSQGQEWSNVYIDAPWLMPAWNSSRWYYTAITRAKSKVEVITNKYLSIK